MIEPVRDDGRAGADKKSLEYLFVHWPLKWWGGRWPCELPQPTPYQRLRAQHCRVPMPLVAAKINLKQGRRHGLIWSLVNEHRVHWIDYFWLLPVHDIMIGSSSHFICSFWLPTLQLESIYTTAALEESSGIQDGLFRRQCLLLYLGYILYVLVYTIHAKTVPIVYP